MAYTLGEAAKATGKSKSTLSKAIKSGKISASKGESGAFHIDASELHRVYPPVSKETPKTVEPETPKNTEETVRIKELEAQLKAAEDRIRDKEDMLSQVRDDLDHWRRQASALLEDNRRATALLEAKTEQAPPAESQDSAVAKPKSFFRRLVGRVSTG